MYFEWTDFQNSSDLAGGDNSRKFPDKSYNEVNRSHVESTKKLLSNENVSSNHSSQQTGQTSSLQSLSIGEIMEVHEADNMGVSAILNYCKCKILRPYLQLLAAMGFRPLTMDFNDTSLCMNIVGTIYTTTIVLLMLAGYLLQYMSCFRRDRGFCYALATATTSSMITSTVDMGTEERIYRQICYGSKTFSYIIPSCLHLAAYLYSLYVFRVANNEQLQSMMERVFLLSSGPSEGSSGQRTLLKLLWFIIGICICWVLLSFFTMVFMLEEGNITFQWIHTSSSALIHTMKLLLIVCTFLHDIVQMAVICSYCIQAQLLKSHLHFLRDRLLQQFITPLEWMREVAEFRKSINYLNNGLAPAVCIFIIVNLSWALSGLLWLIGLDSMDIQTEPIFVISLLNVLLWFVISLAPFIQASRLTAACIQMQTVGHEIRIRPLAYQATPTSDLDSILLYASCLKMNATLFKLPITGRCLYLSLTVLTILILTLGQCHYFQMPEK